MQTLTPNAAIPRFIVGLPRAGTTWMCRSLNEHPDAVAFGETMFWGKGFIAPGANGRYEAADLQRVKAALLTKPFESTLAIQGAGGMQRMAATDIPAILERAFEQLPPAPTPAEFFETLAAGIAGAEQKSHWIEKTPHHLLYAERILRHFPNARFVVMMREPYAFMLSYKHQRGHEDTAESRQRFARRYHPMGAALVWRNSWRAAQRLVGLSPSQVMLVRLEQVKRDPAEIMRKVREFLLLPATESALGVPTKINSAFNAEGAAALGDADVAWMNLLASREIAAAGYELRRWRKRPGALVASTAALPLWILRAIRDLRRTTAGPMSRHVMQWVMGKTRSDGEP